MALKSPAFRKKFPLLVTGSLLAMQPLASQFVVAAEQYDCSVSASGGWDCAPKTPAAALPPRPVHDGSAVSATGEAPAQNGSCRPAPSLCWSPKPRAAA
jgi:LPS-assembly protein